jgi:hypothetical protein
MEVDSDCYAESRCCTGYISLDCTVQSREGDNYLHHVSDTTPSVSSTFRMGKNNFQPYFPLALSLSSRFVTPITL